MVPVRVPALLLGLALLVPALALAGAPLPGPGEPAPGAASRPVRASPAYDADGDRVFDDLDARLAAAPAGARLDVIVVFTGVTLEEGLAAVERALGSVDPRQVSPRLPAAAFGLTKAQVARVAALDEVRQLEFDAPGTPELRTSTHYIGARSVWHDLGVTGDADGNPGAFTKDDAVIAVLDTGIDMSHVDFTGKLLAWHDTVSGSPAPSDSNGHGTHVASIAAGLGLADPDMQGVAPGAALVMVRISQKSHALAAVEWVMDHQATYGIDVMTMSFGFGIGADGTDSLALLFDQAFDAGIVTVKSTGNSGPEYGTMTIPGDAKKILAVGNVEDPGKNGWRLTVSSSRGPTSDGRVKPDLVAPGTGIFAAARGTTGSYTAKTGTSMAAPHVAGVAALVKAANPALDSAGIRQLLVDTAQDRGWAGPDHDYGHGLVDPYAAVQAARGLAGSNPVQQPGVVRLTQSFTAPDAWLLELGGTGHALALTLLTDGPLPIDRRFDVLLTNGDQVVTHPGLFTGGQRHVNLAVAPDQAGLWALVVQGQGLANVHIDASGEWPAQPGPHHGLHVGA